MNRQTGVVLLLILATATMTLEQSSVTNCPFGWVKHDRRCFTYQATSTDWASAERQCMNLGGHLVSIHSEREYNQVKTLIRAHDYRENPTWIGLSACQKRNYFFWSDGTRLTFTKWNPSEPNVLFGECCVHINYGSKKNWNDVHCSWSYPFVCAKTIQ